MDHDGSSKLMVASVAGPRPPAARWPKAVKVSKDPSSIQQRERPVPAQLGWGTHGRRAGSGQQRASPDAVRQTARERVVKLQQALDVLGESSGLRSALEKAKKLFSEPTVEVQITECKGFIAQIRGQGASDPANASTPTERPRVRQRTSGAFTSALPSSNVPALVTSWMECVQSELQEARLIPQQLCGEDRMILQRTNKVSRSWAIRWNTLTMSLCSWRCSVPSIERSWTAFRWWKMCSVHGTARPQGPTTSPEFAAEAFCERHDKGLWQCLCNVLQPTERGHHRTLTQIVVQQTVPASQGALIAANSFFHVAIESESESESSTEEIHVPQRRPSNLVLVSQNVPVTEAPAEQDNGPSTGQSRMSIQTGQTSDANGLRSGPETSGSSC